MDEYTKANLDWWNEAAIVHSSGDHYRLAQFKAGENKLKYLERHEFPFCAWENFPDMLEGADRFCHMKDPRRQNMIPMTFTLKATRLS